MDVLAVSYGGGAAGDRSPGVAVIPAADAGRPFGARSVPVCLALPRANRLPTRSARMLVLSSMGRSEAHSDTVPARGSSSVLRSSGRPRPPERLPGSSQDLPKRRQDGPREPQDGIRRPNRPQENPKTAQDGSKTHPKTLQIGTWPLRETANGSKMAPYGSKNPPEGPTRRSGRLQRPPRSPLTNFRKDPKRLAEEERHAAMPSKKRRDFRDGKM